MSKHKLDACPFCGSNDVEEALLPHPGGFFVECQSCAASTDERPLLADAVELWNRRAQPAEEIQPVNDLLKQFKEVYPKAMTEFAEQMKSMGITSAPIGNHQASMFKLERAIYDALAAKDTP